MVYAFVIHTVGSSAPTILFQSVYTTASTTTTKDESTTSTTHQDCEIYKQYKQQQLEKIKYIADNVNSDVSFQRAVSEPRFRYDDSDFDINTYPYDHGFIHLEKDDFTQSDKVVIWVAVRSCAFVLVCEKHENRALAESILKLVITCVEKNLHFIAQPVQVMQKNDIVATIVETVMPNGLMLFMNHRVVRKIERELESALSMKI